jgi:hypothetical protein
MVLALAERPFEYADIGFWLFGCSYAALLLVSTRLWLLWRQRTDLVFAHLPPLLLQFVPALALALGANAALHIPSAENLFIYPGFGGWVAAPLAGALFLEAWLRTRRRTAAAASLALPCSAMAGGENPSERAPSREGAE